MNTQPQPISPLIPSIIGIFSLLLFGLLIWSLVRQVRRHPSLAQPQPVQHLHHTQVQQIESPIREPMREKKPLPPLLSSPLVSPPLIATPPVAPTPAREESIDLDTVLTGNALSLKEIGVRNPIAFAHIFRAYLFLWYRLYELNGNRVIRDRSQKTLGFQRAGNEAPHPFLAYKLAPLEYKFLMKIIDACDIIEDKQLIEEIATADQFVERVVLYTKEHWLDIIHEKPEKGDTD